MIFVGQTKLTIELETNTDLTTATSAQIRFLNPSKQQGSLTATISGTKISYAMQEGDLNMAGDWRIWAYIVFADGKVGVGEAVKMQVKKQGDL